MSSDTEDGNVEFDLGSCDDSSSYNGSCELTDSQENLTRDSGYLEEGCYFNTDDNSACNDSRAMSLTTKGPSTGYSVEKKVPPVDFRSNGSGPYPLAYPSEPPDDENMNEVAGESVDVHVILPGGTTKDVSVNSNIPMMDLLVNLAAGSKLNPGSHSLQLLNEDTGKLKDFKPNQTIGSLCVRGEDHKFLYVTVQIVQKKSELKKSSGNIRNAQPFEMTKRFTVNLPGGQKKVLRISPQSTLEQIRAQLCEERQYNPSRYSFQLPSSPSQQLDLKTTIGELPSSEINFVSANATIDGAKSMPDLSIGRSQSMKTENQAPYMPTAGEGKKKKGFFSFLKKDKKFTVSMQSDLNHAGKQPQTTSSKRESGSPPVMRRKADQTARPQTMYVTSSAEMSRPAGMIQTSSDLDLRISQQPLQSKSAPSLKSVNENSVLPAKSGKKKRAPPPPQVKQNSSNTVKTVITIENQQNSQLSTMPARAEQKVSETVLPLKEDQRVPENGTATANQQLAQKLHSRNSSDSSGYHELTLSGAESPDTAKIEENMKFKTSLDTASIDSNDHQNGDSGIRDISPSRRKERPKLDMETGSSATLPLDKVSKNVPTRSRSLERPSGVKKKKAPPPPGQAPPQPPSSSSQKPVMPKPARKSSDSTAPIATSSPRSKVVKKDEKVVINAVLDDLDNHLDNHHGDELEDQQMMMVENVDISVEEVDQPRSVRPCAFVAPPPPEEPPPEDVEIVSYNEIMGLKVDTVDIGTETSDDSASLEPGSPKSSPKISAPKLRDTMHSRAESRTSMSSVNTIEDINMGFELAILAGQEAMLEESSEEDEETYKHEVAQFKERMSKEIQSHSKNLAEPEQKEMIEKVDVNQSADESKDIADVKKTDDQEVSEITYSFTVDAVPPEFREEDKEEEEEYTESITEVYPLPVSMLDNSRKIPDLDSPKEHAFPSGPMQGTIEADVSAVTTTKETVVNEEVIESKQELKDVKQEVKEIKQEVKVVEQEVKKEEKPVKKEKEEFILTFDDLNNIDFSGPKKPKAKPDSLNIRPKSMEVNRKSATVTSPVLVLEELRSRFKSEGEENVLITPLKQSKSNGSIKERCNELSFTPNSEGEVEHVLEEKSISLMNLPAMRCRTSDSETVKVEKLDLSQLDTTDGVSNSQQKNDATDGVSDSQQVNDTTEKVSNSKQVNGNLSDNSDNKINSVVSSSSNSNAGSGPNSARSSGASSNLEVDPREQMQQQFEIWQQQLEKNQKLLASQAVPSDEQSLQLQQQLQAQIHLQQQMLSQMQKSMETLTVKKSSDNQKDNVSPKESPRLELEKEVVIISKETKETPDIPVAPEAPAAPVFPQMRSPRSKQSTEKSQTDQDKSEKDKTAKPKKRGGKKFEPKLDPREELMLAIRGFQGRSQLKKVSVTQTKWVSGPATVSE